MSSVSMTGDDQFAKHMKTLDSMQRGSGRLMAWVLEDNASEALYRVQARAARDPKTQVDGKVQLTSPTRVGVKVRISSERGPFGIRQVNTLLRKEMDRAVSDAMVELRRLGVQTRQ